MRIFKNAWFNRFANKEDITDDDLRDTVDLLQVEKTGQISVFYVQFSNRSCP